MDMMNWMGFVFAACSLSMAASALSQVGTLARELRALREELQRRGILEGPAEPPRLILPGDPPRK